jgi:hypothetical protein
MLTGLVLLGTVLSFLLVVSIFIIASFAVVMLFAFLQRKGMSQMQGAFKAAATEVGGHYVEARFLSYPRIDGAYRKRRFEIRVESNGEDDPDTVIRVWHKGRKMPEIKVRKRTALTGLESAFFGLSGFREVDIGPGLRSQFIAWAKEGGADARDIAIDMGRGLLALQLNVRISVMGDVMNMKRDGYLNDKDSIVRILNILNDIAERIERM